MSYVPANFRDADLVRVLHALEKAGHKVRKVRVTREAAEIFVVDDEPVTIETRTTTEAEAGGFYDENGRPLPLG
jgi:hypothetical protein